MADIDIAALANLLQEAAVKEILPRFRNLGEGDVRMKTEAIDLVTEADEAAERLIHSRIKELMPDAVFIGEEAVAADPALLDKLADAELAVVVDPIDGTFNFAAGLPLFGVMLSVVRQGETVAGLIYDPMGNDWAIVEKGSGAWLCKPDGNQEKMEVRPAPDLAQMIGIANVGFFEREARRKLLVNLAEVRLFTSYRCAAHEYRILCQGHMHFAMYNKLMPWDHLAGTLMAQEAGAYAARFDGSAYLPHHTSGGLLIAPDKESWTELREKIFNV
ncbi:inositol monophosphatase family protein [Agrobacterium vitis]|uniref:inositol monophosphatase family protein n=1 Tax=Agrobacterium vitis TaxID=373 RepID=UPI000872D4CA|nr:inositol monophosphatase [Agrobacterium vitis]MCE6077949.1 inositol monophosphatase [Agrobacterium vitis]MCM2470573.1 inositol monophosphatase [Agrobacterium vitis]MUO72667.1 inositol monophosphatase [Agrobacterium vitis]MUO86620.1 inositol monophosphatase [Agrobacterium vitis]MVA35938.1 inositol monophosphatase [Agrobacterium vitis]